MTASPRPTIGRLMVWVALVAGGCGLLRVNPLLGFLTGFVIISAYLAGKITRDHVHRCRASGLRLGPVHVGVIWAIATVFSAIILLIPAVVTLGLGLAAYGLARRGDPNPFTMTLLGLLGSSRVAWLTLKIVQKRF